jgi:hypothetical protein
VNQRAPALSRAVYAALAVVVLLGAVAFASRGHHTPGTGGGHAREPVQILFDIVFTLAVVFGIAILFAVAFMHARTAPTKRKSSLRPFLILGIFAALLASGLIVLPRIHTPQKPRSNIGNVRSVGHNQNTGKQSGLQRAEKPVFHWSVAIGTIALLVAGFAVLVAAERRRRRGDPREFALAMELAGVLDETLDDLRAEPDARKAIIAAYARMERALALHGLPRRESEAPLEYMARVLSDLTASERAVRRLTDLFAVAKFSDHPIDAAMKDRAIAALESVRDHLRAVGGDDPPPLKRAPAETAEALR